MKPRIDQSPSIFLAFSCLEITLLTNRISICYDISTGTWKGLHFGADCATLKTNMDNEAKNVKTITAPYLTVSKLDEVINLASNRTYGEFPASLFENRGFRKSDSFLMVWYIRERKGDDLFWGDDTKARFSFSPYMSPCSSPDSGHCVPYGRSRGIEFDVYIRVMVSSSDE